MDSNLPIIAIELVLVFGGALLFGWWQLRSIKRDQRKAATQREVEAQQAQAAAERHPEPGSEKNPTHE